MGTKNKVIKVIAFVALALIVVAVIGFVAVYTNGFSEEFQNFYLEIDGEKITSVGSGYDMAPNKPLTVNVKYALGSGNDSPSGYSVTVITKEGVDFDYTVDDEFYSFKDLNDVTSAFEIVKAENGSFTIAPKGTLQLILDSFYPGKTVEYDRVAAESNLDLFTMIVSSNNGEATVRINFTVCGQVYEVTLDREEIIF